MAIQTQMDELITITSTKQSLYSILAAINPNAPRTVQFVQIFGSDGQTANVLIGNSQLADNKYSRILTSGGDWFEDKDEEGRNVISLTVIYLKVEGAGGDQSIPCKVRCT